MSQNIKKSIIVFVTLAIVLLMVSSANAGPILKFGEIKKTGLCKFSVEIKNVGDEVAHEAFFNITLSENLFLKLFFKNPDNFIPGAYLTLIDIQPNETLKVPLILTWIGRLDMNLTVGLDNITMDSKNYKGFGFFLYFFMWPKITFF